MRKKKYKVSGMSCAACSSKVEKTVSLLAGVDECRVNLLLGSMTVEGAADANEIIAAVEAIGYGAELEDGTAPSYDGSEELLSRGRIEKRKIAIRLSVSAVLLVMLMYISMGHTMLNFPLPAFMSGNYSAIGSVQLAISAAILVINNRFFITGLKGMLRLAPNMDSLVAIGSGASFIYSVCLLVLIFVAQSDGNSVYAAELLHGLYFEAAAMIPVLITVGKLLEARAKGATTNAISELMMLAPKQASVERDGAEIILSASEIKVGDIMVVRRGESICTDGTVVFGSASINEAMLTGESLPVDKTAGNQVFGGTELLSGYIKVRVEKVGEGTMLSEIVRTVKEAAESKAPVAKIADKVSGVFVPVVIGIGIIASLIWLILGAEIGYALARGVSVLVISCPCALGLATPVAIMVGSGVGARHGILYKTAAAIEETGRIKTVALDKTGTVTEGRPSVAGMYALGASEGELISKACAIEKMSEHPLARAIVEYASELGEGREYEVENFTQASRGIYGFVDGKRIACGNASFIGEITGGSPEQDAEELVYSLSEKGNTPILVYEEDRCLGVIALADRIKPESAAAISALKKLGIRVVMLTGDNRGCAEAVAKELGMDEVYAEVLPNEKAEQVKKMSANGGVCMVGDGINDAPALTSASVGMAIGAGSHIALSSADVVLVGGNLTSVTDAVRLGRRTLKNIYLNLFWAFCYNIVGIPLAAGAFTSILGWSLSPMIGAFAMSISSFLVVSSSLTINLFKPTVAKNKNDGYVNSSLPNTEENCCECEVSAPDCNAKNENNMRNETENETDMKNTVIINIEGMMCPHCSGRVKSLLEGLSEVSSADVSHERGNAVIELNADCELSKLEKVITDAGYKVVG